MSKIRFLYTEEMLERCVANIPIREKFHVLQHAVRAWAAESWNVLCGAGFGIVWKVVWSLSSCDTAGRICKSSCTATTTWLCIWNASNRELRSRICRNIRDSMIRSQLRGSYFSSISAVNTFFYLAVRETRKKLELWYSPRLFFVYFLPAWKTHLYPLLAKVNKWNNGRPSRICVREGIRWNEHFSWLIVNKDSS